MKSFVEFASGQQMPIIGYGMWQVNDWLNLIIAVLYYSVVDWFYDLCF